MSEIGRGSSKFQLLFLLEMKYNNLGIILGVGLNCFFFKIRENRSNWFKFSGLGNEICKFWNHIRGWTKMGNFYRTHNNYSKSVQFSVIVPLGVRNKICKFWNHIKGWTKLVIF